MAEYSLYLEKAPPRWNTFHLGDICTRVQDNYQPDPNGARLYLGLEHLAQGLPILVGRGSEADVKSSKNSFRQNDILFGKLRPYLRKCILAQEEGVCSTDILVFRCKDKILPQYLCYLCHNDQFVGYAKATTSGVQHPRTSWNSLNEFLVTLPPIDEQCFITHVLSTVQTAIEQQARMIAITQELKRALMHKLFTEGLNGEKQKMTEIGPVPDSWEIKPFETFTTLQRGKDLTKSEFKDGSIPVAGSNGIIGYHDAAFVKAPGITVGRSGSTGKVRLYEKDFWAHNTSLYVKDFHGNDPRFTAYFLEVLNLSRFKTGASVPTLDRNAFRQIPVAVPANEEQVEIGRTLTVIDNKIELISLNKTKLEELFRTLLNQLMTGQIRVNDIDLPGFS
jgi:type I restriction enzyme, S subunit